MFTGLIFLWDSWLMNFVIWMSFHKQEDKMDHSLHSKCQHIYQINIISGLIRKSIILKPEDLMVQYSEKHKTKYNHSTQLNIRGMRKLLWKHIGKDLHESCSWPTCKLKILSNHAHSSLIIIANYVASLCFLIKESVVQVWGLVKTEELHIFFFYFWKKFLNFFL